MSATGIEWTETTWNPVTGCDRISAGCDHCYALAMAKRLKAMGSFAGMPRHLEEPWMNHQHGDETLDRIVYPVAPTRCAPRDS